MQHWMRTRVLRTVGLLFALTLMLSACGAAGDLPDLIGGGDPPVGDESEPAPDDVSDDSEPDDVSDESEPGDVSDESEPEEGDDHEHQCFRNGGGDDDESGDEAADETI
jgi:hypothetical protein